MSAAKNPKPNEPPSLPTRERFDALVAAANQGDKEAIKQLGELLDKHPEFWQSIGDVGRHAELLIILRIAGSDVLARDAVQRQVSAMRKEMYGTNPSQMEKLLIDSYLLSWLQLQYVNIQHPTAGDTSVNAGRFILQQKESAQRQLHAALNALNLYRKFAPAKLALVRKPAPATVPFSNATKPPKSASTARPKR